MAMALLRASAGNYRNTLAHERFSKLRRRFPANSARRNLDAQLAASATGVKQVQNRKDDRKLSISYSQLKKKNHIKTHDME